MGPRIREDTGGEHPHPPPSRGERKQKRGAMAARFFTALRCVQNDVWGAEGGMGPRIREDTGGGLHVGGGGHAHEGEAAAEDDAGGGG